MIAVKYILISFLAFSVAMLAGSKSKVTRVISAKWAFDILAILVLGANRSHIANETYAFALVLIGCGVIFSFIWLMLRNEGFRDHDKL